MMKRNFARKGIALVLALTLAVGMLAGCSGSTTETTTAEETEAVTAAETAETEEAAETGEETTAKFVPGTYEGSATGMSSTVTVSVTVDENEITAIDVTDYSGETQNIAKAAVEIVPQEIIDSQSVSVDAATGATITSAAIRMAVANALEDVCSGNLYESVTKDETVPEHEDETVDIVIVGGGGSGLSAAVAAKSVNSDASVLVLEKLSYTGGSTALSGGVMIAGGTDRNGVDGIDDFTADEYVDYFVTRLAEMDLVPEGMEINTDLIYRIGSMSGAYFTYLESLGLDMPDAGNYAEWADGRGLAGFKNNELTGSVFGEWFTNLAEEKGAEVRTNSTVVGLISEDNTVEGVVVESDEGNYNVYAQKVILCCGGYGSNAEMIEEINGDYYDNLDLTYRGNCPGDTGDAFTLTEDLNAATTGFGLIVVPGATQIGFRSALDSASAYQTVMYVNEDGERFGNEDNSYHIMLQTLSQPDGVCYGLIGSDAGTFTYKGVEYDIVELMEGAVESGRAYKADSLEELAEQIGAESETLVATVEHYNEMVDNGVDEDYGASVSKKLDADTYYAVRLYPDIIATLGGLVCDDQCRILNEDGEVIENLYGAGEVILANIMLQEYYTGGIAVSTAVYTGAICGAEAANSLN